MFYLVGWISSWVRCLQFCFLCSAFQLALLAVHYRNMERFLVIKKTVGTMLVAWTPVERKPPPPPTTPLLMLDCPGDIDTWFHFWFPSGTACSASVERVTIFQKQMPPIAKSVWN